MPNHPSANIPNCFSTTIRHIQFDACLDRLRELVRMKTSTRIVIVTGPTGAGKTTLREQFCSDLEAIAAPEMEKNPEMVPYGACAVKAPGPTAFSWKDTYLQQLHSLQHPFADARSMLQPKAPPTSDQSLKSLSPEAAHRLSNDRLFRILQRTISHRQPQALIFDEAHHLLRLASSQSLVNQLEHLKYIADETRTLHVLFGTYELTRLMDLSSALIRRREIVHFPRYIYDSKDAQTSLAGFADVVAVFARDLDEVCTVDLLTEVPYLYQGCVGCVGVLRDWLFRAYSAAKSVKAGKITKKLLDQTILAASDRLELVKDARIGENYFEKRSLCEEEYLVQLGFSAADPSSPESAAPKEPKGRKTPAFQRKPHNDPVGTEHLGAKEKKAA